MYKRFHAAYIDLNQHFDNDVFKIFLFDKNITMKFNSSSSFKNIDIIKLFNKLVESILRKNHSDIN